VPTGVGHSGSLLTHQRRTEIICPDVAAVDPAWGRLTAYQAHGLACAGCGRSFLESERVAGGWVGPLDAVAAGPSPIAGFDLRVCQDCADATDHCEEDGWQTAREFDQTEQEESQR
jgi:hypothetical protein